MAEEGVPDEVNVVPPDEQRCRRTSGKNWRCKYFVTSANPMSYCDYHYNKYKQDCIKSKQKRKPRVTPDASSSKSRKSSGLQHDLEGDLKFGLVSVPIPLNSASGPFGGEASNVNDFFDSEFIDYSSPDKNSPDENDASTARVDATSPGCNRLTFDNGREDIQSDPSSDHLPNAQLFLASELLGASSSNLHNAQPHNLAHSVSQANAASKNLNSAHLVSQTNSAPRSSAQPSSEPDFDVLLRATLQHCNQFMSSAAKLQDAHNHHSCVAAGLRDEITHLKTKNENLTGELFRVKEELARCRSHKMVLQSLLDEIKTSVSKANQRI